MTGDLGTTNVMLGIIAAVSVLQALVLLGAGIAIFIVYRRTTGLLEVLEVRHVAPTMVRVHSILDDVKDVTGRVREEAFRVDETIGRVRSNVRAKTDRIVRVVQGLRGGLAALLHNGHRDVG